MTLHIQRPAPARRAARTLLPLLIGACFTGAGAAPTSPTVVAGQATFVQQGNVFSITNTPNTIINWKSFSVDAGEITRFIQQNADSAVLNRITGQDPTKILGALQSNGHVFLINPNGIMFGKDARIDVKGLAASTLDLANADFLAGKNIFKAGKQAGAIVNQGQITTPSGGRVFLVATDVKNAGVITSPQGQVVLAAGHSVQLVDSANPDLHVVISAPSDQAINLGQIMSQGGRIGIYGALVNQRGVINADSAQVGANGKIVLKASRDAMLDAGSVTSATGAGAGGQVSVEGKRVGMVGDARIDASGNTGGGTVLLGGGYQGKHPSMTNAQQTLLGKDASIRADALVAGNGGTVVLWGDQSTRAIGQVSAQGGALAGNGGLVETSGKHLDVNGIRVNAGARNGAAGTWLLDPYDIDITNSGTVSLSNVDQFVDGGSGSAQIHPNTINSVAAGTNVVLQATHNVTVTNAVAPNLGAGGSLRIDAGNDINVSNAISTNGGALVLTANHPSYASGTGKVTVMPSAAINTGGGDLSISAVSADYGGTIATSGGNININTVSFSKFANNVSTGNGALTINAGLIDFGGAGTSVSSGSGATLLRSSGGFVLGANWTLSSASNIDVIANSASLFGNIGGVGGARPTLSFSPYSGGAGIDVTSGTGSGLVLDPLRLQAFNVDSLILGSNTTGNINFLGAYSGLANFLTLTGQGDIYIANPITMPAGTGSGLLLSIDRSASSTITTKAALSADSIFMAASNVSVGGQVIGTGSAGRIKIAPNVTTTPIVLGVGASDGGGALALDDAEAGLLTASAVQIGGNAGQSGAVTVTAGGVNFAGLAPGSVLTVSASEANLTLNGNLVTPGSLNLVGNDLQTAAAAKAKAASLQLTSSFGIGADGVPFNTETSALSAVNTRSSGIAPINISNLGTLSLGSIHQNDATNTGPVAVVNAGGMTLATGASVTTHGSGSVTLKTMSPLTIDGSVTTEGGNINLEAGNGGLLTIGFDGVVQSGSGNIGMIAGDIVNNGVVNAGSGAVNLSAATVTGGGSFAGAGGVAGLPGPITNGPPPPTVAACVADPALPDCAAIVKAAFDACLLVPSGADCALVLPTVAACTTDKNLPGCSVVLPTIQTCIGDKNTAGCAVVLPSIQTCVGDKNILGCSVVLPALQVCVGDKSIAGCEVVLPSVQQCIGDKSIAGCSVVLPALATCIGDKNILGCVVVLPSLPSCVQNPVQAGCQVVLPTIAMCIGDKNLEGCSVVLPSLGICITTPNQAGCSVVLPSIAQCIANPATAGCSVVLPSVAQCVLDKNLAGCAVVLPSLAQCIASPAMAGCHVVLPTLSQCVANASLAGCSVVLPSLAQCVASPTLQGCSVVLPPLSACVANPAAPGCVVVVPPVQAPAGGVVAQAINTTISVINAANEQLLQKDDKKLDVSKIDDIKLVGEKSDIRKKTYCN